MPVGFNLGAGGGLPEEQLAAILPPLTALLRREKPDWLLVYGDTTSTLAGALAAVMAGVPLAHVEAGLRSFDRTMPEENNRIVVDALAQLLFTPTAAAADATRSSASTRRLASVKVPAAPAPRRKARRVSMWHLSIGKSEARAEKPGRSIA